MCAWLPEELSYPKRKPVTPLIVLIPFLCANKAPHPPIIIDIVRAVLNLLGIAL
jgi:hypothetical protein